jgi:hypothetical protein
MAALRLCRIRPTGRVLLLVGGFLLSCVGQAWANTESVDPALAARAEARPAVTVETESAQEEGGGVPVSASAESARTQETDAADPAENARATQAEAEKAEAKRQRQERVVAFARRRVREMAERKRALARTLAAERARAKASEEEASRVRARKEREVVPTPLPEIVDHRSALERQLAAHWGWGADKDRQVRVPLPDWQNWQRVRLFGVEHLAAFRYTKQHHTLTAVFAVETRAQKPSSLTCMDEFERRGFPELVRHGVHIEPIDAKTAQWDQRPVLVHETEGRVTFLFSRYEFSAAWTAYPAYDHGCLVYATVVLWDGQPELARRVLDRFVAEGVAQVRPLTTSVPSRLEEGPQNPPAASRSARERSETAQNGDSPQRARRTSP